MNGHFPFGAQTFFVLLDTLRFIMICFKVIYSVPYVNITLLIRHNLIFLSILGFEIVTTRVLFENLDSSM